jgi:adenylosuccinate synthase
MGLIAQSDEPRVDVLIGGEFGSEGKGNIAFYLAPEYDVLVRVGGPNAGHVVPTSPPYTHRSLPSGTLAHEGAQLVIGPGAVINPGVLLQEIADCGVEGGRLVIDPQCGIIDDQAIQDEEALVTEIGSTAQGVGVGMARRILERGAYAKHGGATRHLLARDVPELAPYTSRTAREVLSDAFSIGARVLLEGTQGTGLSLYHGYYPSVTSRDTSVSGCLSEAGISPRRVRKIIMVCRTYPIRVGGPSGFLSQEITWGDVAERSGQDADELRAAERGSVSGRERRVSEFDWKLLHEAAELNGATDIALTFADHLSAINSRARRFDQLTAETRRFIEEVEHVAGCPVTLVSCRFDQRSVLDRRSWRGHVFSPRLDGEV